MLAFFKRGFSNEIVLSPLRETAKAIANEFVLPGMKNHFNQWADHFFIEGLAIKDEKQLQEYTKTIKDDIEALKRQTKIQKLYDL